MNTSAKILFPSQVLSQNKSRTSSNVNIRDEALILPAPRFYILILMLAMVLSSLSLVYVKNLNRSLFLEYQKEKKNSIKLQLDEGKLLFNQGLLAPHTKIQDIAENQFDMQMPFAKDVVIVKEV